MKILLVSFPRVRTCFEPTEVLGKDLEKLFRVKVLGMLLRKKKIRCGGQACGHSDLEQP